MKFVVTLPSSHLSTLIGGSRTLKCLDAALYSFCSEFSVARHSCLTALTCIAVYFKSHGHRTSSSLVTLSCVVTSATVPSQPASMSLQRYANRFRRCRLHQRPVAVTLGVVSKKSNGRDDGIFSHALCCLSIGGEMAPKILKLANDCDDAAVQISGMVCPLRKTFSLMKSLT